MLSPWQKREHVFLPLIVLNKISFLLCGPTHQAEVPHWPHGLLQHLWWSHFTWRQVPDWEVLWCRPIGKALSLRVSATLQHPDEYLLLHLDSSHWALFGTVKRFPSYHGCGQLGFAGKDRENHESHRKATLPCANWVRQSLTQGQDARCAEKAQSEGN